MQFDIRRLASVTSTMDLASALAHAGAREGVVICADEQTAGRGRRGRVWSSPSGAGLYLSLVLRPPYVGKPFDCTQGKPFDSAQGKHEIRELPFLTLAAGVAVHDALLRAAGLVTALKWPNDVVINGRKLAGILAEGFNIGSRDQAVVLGIGINVRDTAFPPEIADRATSIERELGKEIDRAVLLDVVLAAVGARYDQLRDGKADDILRDWRLVAPSAIGARVHWADGRHGVTAGIDHHGALLVQTDQGLERVIAGELQWN